MALVVRQKIISPLSKGTDELLRDFEAVTRDAGGLALSPKTPFKPVLLLLEVRRSLLIPSLMVFGSNLHT